MSTVSKRRPPVRPKPIAEFCDEILELYRPNHSGTYYSLRRLAAFLAGHSSVKTTADLTVAAVAEYDRTLGDLSERHRVDSLRAFRRACRLAVDSGYLKRDPFDDYPLPTHKRRNPRVIPGETPLNEEQVRNIMGYLEARKASWKGHRLYAFTASVLYQELRTSEALQLTLAGSRTSEALQLTLTVYDPASGKIQVPNRIRRAKGLEPFSGREETIHPSLEEILAEWLPSRREGKPGRGIRPPFGKDLVDGRTLVPNEAEQGVIIDMIRWRHEGWSLERIVAELDRRGIPTKHGRGKWAHSTVRRILSREERAETGIAPSASDDEGRGGDGSEDEPDWVFPSIGHKVPEKGPWTANIASDRLQEAGNAVGIKGLSYEALRRFHRHQAWLNPGWNHRTTRTGRPSSGADITPAESEPLPPPAGDPDAELARLRPKSAKVIRALIDAGPEGLTGATLGAISRVPSWWKILDKLKRSSPYWDARIHFPGVGGVNYSIKMI